MAVVNDEVPVTRILDEQQSIPSAWRPTLTAIVDAFAEGDLQLRRGVPDVRPISDVVAQQMRDYVDDYGAVLAPLPPDTWQTSVCQWMDGYWDVLVDLFTLEEGASDLVLTLRVYEEGAAYAFDIGLIYVP